MKYARGSRHYRVAKRQAEQNADVKATKGTFIPDKDKKKLFAMAGCVALLSFVLGFFIGAVLDIED
jgi:hypothetical protein